MSLMNLFVDLILNVLNNLKNKQYQRRHLNEQDAITNGIISQNYRLQNHNYMYLYNSLVKCLGKVDVGNV